MALSHKYKFILIKTRKTAGSSIQIYLSRFCGENDIVSPIDMPEQSYTPRNFRGLYNPLPDIAERGSFHEMMKVLGCFFTLKKFQSHIKAREARRRVSRDIWEGNFKFAVERNPWGKALSHYHFVRQRYRKYDENISFEKYLEAADPSFNNKKYTDESGKIIVDGVRVLRGCPRGGTAVPPHSLITLFRNIRAEDKRFPEEARIRKACSL